MTWTLAFTIALLVLGVPPFLYLCARFITVGIYGAKRDCIIHLKDRRSRNGK